MNKDTLLYITLVILLIPFFLVSIGLENETPALWWTGMVLLGVGGILPPIARYAFNEEEDEEDSEEIEKDEGQKKKNEEK